MEAIHYQLNTDYNKQNITNFMVYVYFMYFGDWQANLFHNECAQGGKSHDFRW